MKKTMRLGLLALALLLLLGGISVGARGRNAVRPLVFVSTSEAERAGSTAAEIWQSLERYAAEKEDDAQLQRCESTAVAAQLLAIEEALRRRPRLIVCYGEDFAEAVYLAQVRYPEQAFLLLGAEPCREGLYETRSNTHCLLLRESELGFLAGYAAVMDGARKLGFCASEDSAAQRRRASGFYQGAEEAARRLGLSAGSIDIVARFDNMQEEFESLYEAFRLWYGQDRQILLSEDHEGRLTRALLAAARDMDGTILSSPVDRSALGERIAASVQGDYSAALYEALEEMDTQEGTWRAARAGSCRSIGTREGAIYLARPERAWPFAQYKEADHEALIAQLRAGELVLQENAARGLLPLAPHCRIQETRA